MAGGVLLRVLLAGTRAFADGISGHKDLDGEDLFMVGPDRGIDAVFRLSYAFALCVFQQRALVVPGMIGFGRTFFADLLEQGSMQGSA